MVLMVACAAMLRMPGMSRMAGMLLSAMLLSAVGGLARLALLGGLRGSRSSEGERRRGDEKRLHVMIS